MISLITSSASVARSQSSKRVTAAHLKRAVLANEQFDFLTDIVGKVPDRPGANHDDEDEGGGSGDEVKTKPAKKTTKGTSGGHSGNLVREKKRKDNED